MRTHRHVYLFYFILLVFLLACALLLLLLLLLPLLCLYCAERTVRKGWDVRVRGRKRKRKKGTSARAFNAISTQTINSLISFWCWSTVPTPFNKRVIFRHLTSHSNRFQRDIPFICGRENEQTISPNGNPIFALCVKLRVQMGARLFEQSKKGSNLW